MYNVYGVGKRIAACRKMLGLTQEELAVKLNITAQAVSKWENELSFPEITILPFLANTLNTTIEKLFGNEEAIGNAAIKEHYAPRFPDSKGGNLKLVHTLGGVACYSEKEVDVTNEDTVCFKDGSSANLRQLKVVNKGVGEICFDFIDEALMYSPNIDMNKTEISESYPNIDSVEIVASDANYKVVRSGDSQTYIKATGSPVFIAGLTHARLDGMLSVKCGHENNRGGGSGGKNNVIISLGCDTGKIIRSNVNGNGDITVDVPFESGHASINGSGEITLTGVNSFEGKINGCGNINCGKIGNSQISINGSGDIDIREAFGFFKSKINGSGDISLGMGKLDLFEAAIGGSGSISASGISTKKANVSIEGSGDMTIGWVIEESIEKHSRSSSIKVLRRG